MLKTLKVKLAKEIKKMENKDKKILGKDDFFKSFFVFVFVLLRQGPCVAQVDSD